MKSKILNVCVISECVHEMARMNKNSLVAIRRNEGRPTNHITILSHTLIDMNYITSHTFAYYYYYDSKKIAEKLDHKWKT